MSIFAVTGSKYTVAGAVGDLPLTYRDMARQASLHEDFGIETADGTPLVVTVSTSPFEWPQLVIAQRFDPGPVSGFDPGALLVEETDLLFLGAGTRLLTYDLKKPHRIWEDTADIGFWGWRRHGDLVVMSAELELAAWNHRGRKLWSTIVEPPWSYEFREGQIELDVMGAKSIFDAMAGPSRRVEKLD